jgi:hypothetical protein
MVLFCEQVLLLRRGSQEEERFQKLLFPTLKSKHPGKKRKAESDGDSIGTTCSNKAEKTGGGRGNDIRKALGVLDTSRDFGLRKKDWHLV